MIIAIASGKMGTEKTLVATNLAISLKDRGKANRTIILISQINIK